MRVLAGNGGGSTLVAARRRPSEVRRSATAPRPGPVEPAATRAGTGRQEADHVQRHQADQVTPSTAVVTLYMRSTSQYCMVSARVLLWLVITFVVTVSLSVAVAIRIPVRAAWRRPAAWRSVPRASARPRPMSPSAPRTSTFRSGHWPARCRSWWRRHPRQRRTGTRPRPRPAAATENELALVA